MPYCPPRSQVTCHTSLEQRHLHPWRHPLFTQLCGEMMPLVKVQACERSSPLIKPSILTLMSFGKALFVGWCAWIGTLVAGSVVLLLLNKTEWRGNVGEGAFLNGLLFFVYLR